VKILHSVEGGDVEQWLESQNMSSCLRLLTFSLFTLLSLYLHAHFIVYLFASISCVVIGIC